MAVEDVIVTVFDKRFDFAGHVAVGDGDTDAWDQLAGELIAGNAAGIQIEQGLADSYVGAIHVAVDVNEGEAFEVYGRCRGSYIAAVNQGLNAFTMKEGQRPLQVVDVVMRVR